jgi:CBS domain-containing protein
MMTKHIVYCVPEDTAEHAASLMKEENIGPIPVVDDRDSRKIVGIITDRDLAVKVVAEGRDSKMTPVEDVMTRNPITCRDNDNIQDALDLMRKHKVRRIPIADENNRILGIIAQADIATRIGDAQKIGDMVEGISE